MTDLEELKHLWAEHGAELATLIAEIAATGGPRFARAAKVGVPAVNALPGLIARVERAEKERDRFREELRYACAVLIGAASAYRAHAGRSGRIRPRSRPDPFFLTRVSDMDKAVEQVVSALSGDTPNDRDREGKARFEDERVVASTGKRRTRSVPFKANG